MRGQSLYDWCKNNGEWGQRLLSEFGDGNNSQSYIDENGMTVTPHNFASGSNKKVKWTCNKGHQWYAMIYRRVYNKRGCLRCSREMQSIRQKTPKQGINDLYTWCINNGEWGQQLLYEFGDGNNTQQFLDEETGTYKSPHDFSYGSVQKIKWTCSKGHEWYTANTYRTYYKSGCPYCNNIGTSYPEQFLYRALLQLYPNTISRGRYKGFEYDITIPEEKTCIEYSGINWHADRLDRDKIKVNICKEHNVRFIQVYEHYGELNTENIFDNDLIIYKVDTNRNIHKKQLVYILDHILKSFGHSISEIDIEKAQTEAFNFMHNIENNNN